MGQLIGNGTQYGKYGVLMRNGVNYSYSGGGQIPTQFTISIDTSVDIRIVLFTVALYKNGARYFKVLLDGTEIASCESSVDPDISSTDTIPVLISIPAGTHSITIKSADDTMFNLIKLNTSAVGAYTYFRIYVTRSKRNGSDTNYTNIGEIQFLFNGLDFSREAGAVYTASSYHAPSTPDCAFDNAGSGSNSTWHSERNNQTLPQWICAQYLEPHLIDTVIITCSSFGYNDWPCNFQIQASNDGETWDILADIVDEPHAGQGVATSYNITDAGSTTYYYSV